MKILISILMIVVALFPKINIINVPGVTTGIRIEDILILILLFITIFMKGYKVKNENLRKISFFFAIYLVICIGSTILGNWLGYVSVLKGILFVLRKFEYFILIYWGYLYYKDEKDSNTIAKFILFTIIFHLIVCVLQYFGYIGSFHGGEYNSLLHQGRITSTFNGSYELCAYLTMASIYFLYQIFSKNKNILFSVIGMILITLCIYISESRISLVCLIAITIIFIMRNIWKHANFKKYLVILITIGLIGLIGLTKTNLIENTRFSMISLSGYTETIKCAWANKSFDKYLSTGSWYGSAKCFYAGTDNSFNLRFNHWAQLLDGFQRNPILGLGVSITTEAADGNFVRILVESGILGLLSWILMILYMLKITKHDDFLNIITRYSLYSLLVGALFIDVFEASKLMIPLWFLLGATIKNNEVKYDKECNIN